MSVNDNFGIISFIRLQQTVSRLCNSLIGKKIVPILYRQQKVVEAAKVGILAALGASQASQFRRLNVILRF